MLFHLGAGSTDSTEENILFFAFRSIAEIPPVSILPPRELQRNHFHSEKGKHTHRGKRVPPETPSKQWQSRTGPQTLLWALGSCWQPTTHTAVARAPHHWLVLAAPTVAQLFSWRYPKCFRLVADETKSWILICLPLYNKFKANGTSFTKLYPISSFQSGEDKIFPLILENSNSTRPQIQGEEQMRPHGYLHCRSPFPLYSPCQNEEPHWTVGWEVYVIWTSLVSETREVLANDTGAITTTPNF